MVLGLFISQILEQVFIGSTNETPISKRLFRFQQLNEFITPFFQLLLRSQQILTYSQQI